MLVIISTSTSPGECAFVGRYVLYWRDHNPPHFHAVYGEADAAISTDDLRILRGALPPRVLGLVIEWARLHQEELADAWERAQKLEPPGKIDPLQ